MPVKNSRLFGEVLQRDPLPSIGWQKCLFILFSFRHDFCAIVSPVLLSLLFPVLGSRSCSVRILTLGHLDSKVQRTAKKYSTGSDRFTPTIGSFNIILATLFTDILFPNREVMADICNNRPVNGQVSIAYVTSRWRGEWSHHDNMFLPGRRAGVCRRTPKTQRKQRKSWRLGR